MTPSVPAGPDRPPPRSIRFQPNPRRWNVVAPDADEPRRVSWLWGLLIALTAAGVAWAVAQVIADQMPTWHNAGVLAGMTVVFTLTLVASRIDLTGLLVQTNPATNQWPWGAWRRAAPVGRVLTMAVGLACIGIVAKTQYDAHHGAIGPIVTVLWLLAIAFTGLAAWWPDLRMPGWLGSIGRWDAGTLRGILLLAVALGTRFIWPGQYPSGVVGDEGVFLSMARAARNGEMPNVFGTGWLDVPNLYPAVMGWLSHFTSDTSGGYRVLSPALGAIGVMATWRLGCRLVGAQAGFYGALILAVMPFHLMFSRSGLFHISDPTFLVLTVLFLHRAVESNRLGDAWLAGTMAGLGWYGYWGARTFPVIVALMLVLVARPLWRIVPLGAFAALGFLVTTAPLQVWFLDMANGFWQRYSSTSIRVTAEWADDPRMAVLTHLRLAVMQPFVQHSAIFYMHRAPFVGWPEAILLAIGMGAVLAALLRTGAWRSFLWLAVPPLFIIGGMGFTDIVHAHRLLVIAPFWTLIMGVGVALGVRYLESLPLRLRRPHASTAATSLALAGMLALASVNLTWFYSNDRLLENWSSVGSLAMSDLAWRLDDNDPPTVILAGPPFVYANSFPQLAFEEPNLTITEVVDPMTDAATVPALDGHTVLMVVPERAGERCAIAAARPDYTPIVISHDGTAIAYLYTLGTIPGLSTAMAPTGTTATVEPPSCP